MTTNTSMIDISAIAFQRNFVHNNTKELSQKVNISYFWLISFRQKIIWFWISWKLYVWLRVRYMITTKLSPPNSLIMLCWVSLLTVSLFVTIVSNSLKGERKKMQKPKMNLKVHNLTNSQSQRPWKLKNSFGVLIPLSHKPKFRSEILTNF